MLLQAVIIIGFLLALLACVYLYFELRNTRNKHQWEQYENARKLFELQILSELSDKIGNSISIKDIAATIASTAEKVFHVSTVSYGIVENDSVEVTTISRENVATQYTSSVKDIVLQSMYGVDPELRRIPVAHYVKNIPVQEHPAQPALQKTTVASYLKNSTNPGAVPADASENSLPLSYFNIPLVINSRFIGMINITSRYAHAYREEDMSMLYRIVNKAQVAIGRIEHLIQAEKGKVDSLVKSLTSGEIFFTLEKDSLHLFTINNAAKRFLRLTKDNPDLINVLGSFNVKPNIIREMKDVILQKKSTIYRNIGIGELKFNLYLTPVFELDSERVIGVALTMQDVTREHETQKIREVFTNMMIHELRAPLTAIKGAADLLQNANTAEEDKTKMRLIIKNASERLLQDVGDLLDSAKIDAGKMQIEKVDANINEVVEKVTQELSYAASDRQILIQNHLDIHLPAFSFDPVRIGQVVMNLVSNSIKYSEPHTLIEVFTRMKENKVIEVEVRDHGNGIEHEKLGTLFQPFSQAHFLKKSKGTGLGLYISKAIVDGHDGKIWLQSEVGKGTQAFLNLPLAANVQPIAFRSGLN